MNIKKHEINLSGLLSIIKDNNLFHEKEKD